MGRRPGTEVGAEPTCRISGSGTRAAGCGRRRPTLLGGGRPGTSQPPRDLHDLQRGARLVDRFAIELARRRRAHAGVVQHAFEQRPRLRVAAEAGQEDAVGGLGLGGVVHVAGVLERGQRARLVHLRERLREPQRGVAAGVARRVGQQRLQRRGGGRVAAGQQLRAGQAAAELHVLRVRARWRRPGTARSPRRSRRAPAAPRPGASGCRRWACARTPRRASRSSRFGSTMDLTTRADLRATLECRISGRYSAKK